MLQGCPSDESVSFINALHDDVPRHTLLYTRHSAVYIANHERLNNLQGYAYTFASHDNPYISCKFRKSVEAHKKLFFKIGAHVILTLKLSYRLVNGSQGHVFVEEDSAVVKFLDSNETHPIPRKDYFQFVNGKLVPVCSKIPMLLAFALTIHKWQGSTLNSVFVECSGAFDSGQISVALGRVRSQTTPLCPISKKDCVHHTHPQYLTFMEDRQKTLLRNSIVVTWHILSCYEFM